MNSFSSRWFHWLTITIGTFVAGPAMGQGQADAPGKSLTLEQTQALADEADQLRKKAAELFNKNQLAEAIKANARSLALCEQIFPKADFPHGHEALATGFGLQAALLKAVW
jgi:hypothetical protein